MGWLPYTIDITAADISSTYLLRPCSVAPVTFRPFDVRKYALGSIVCHAYSEFRTE